MCPFCVYLTMYNLLLERGIHLIPVIPFCTQEKKKKDLFTARRCPWEKSTFLK